MTKKSPQRRQQQKKTTSPETGLTVEPGPQTGPAAGLPNSLVLPQHLPALQRTVGNRAVQHLLTRPGGAGAVRHDIIQRTLSQQEARDRAERVRQILRATQPAYSDLDSLLVSPSSAEVHQVYQQYIAAYGRRSFSRDLSAFVRRIPARPGQSPEDAQRERDSYWDRYAARLYDAGVREIQAEFHEARPVPVTDANQRLVLARWREHFDGGAWSGEPYAPLARYILQHWQRIRGVQEVRRRGWMPPIRTEDYRASFAILSAQPDAQQAGVTASQTYWATIHSHFQDSLRQTAEMAVSYHQSYVAAHAAGPLAWNPAADPPPMRPELERGIQDWHAINAWNRLPNPEGEWISHWLRILGHWLRNEYVFNWLMNRAGLGAPISASP